MIRLVAIDLDGTLLNSAKEVTSPTLEALHDLQKNVKIVIASARPPRSVRPTYQALKLDTLQVNYNGAMIWDEPAKKTFFHHPMEPAEVLSLVAHARKEFDEVLVSCEVQDKWYTDRPDNTYTTETGKFFKPDLIAPLEEWCTLPITKLLFLGHPEMIEKLSLSLAKPFADAFGMYRTDPELIQIMNRRASKAIAVERVAKHYGVSMQEVLAIGDAPNDVAMIQMAGVGVAMDNAHPAVKAVADWIAPSNDDHGVHAALVKFGLVK